MRGKDGGGVRGKSEERRVKSEGRRVNRQGRQGQSGEAKNQKAKAKTQSGGRAVSKEKAVGGVSVLWAAERLAQAVWRCRSKEHYGDELCQGCSVNGVDGRRNSPGCEVRKYELAGTVLRYAMDRPRIVCLCGSTRFKDEFLEHQKWLTLHGYIVLSVGFFGHVDGMPTPKEKRLVDELHLRKIDLADEVRVVNVGGYVGRSTRREIAYAHAQKKTVVYLYARGDCDE